MSEHVIRLRGGWLSVDPNAPPDHSSTARRLRVTLPTTWPDEASSVGVVRLIRSFGPPPLDPTRDRLTLRLVDIGGLISAHLNGQEIARPAIGTTALDISLLLPLPQRNLLVLDVKVGPTGAGPEPLARPWGSIALVIGARESSAHAGPRFGFEANPGTTPPGDGNDLLGRTEFGA